jgi:hypothetical protein
MILYLLNKNTIFFKHHDIQNQFDFVTPAPGMTEPDTPYRRKCRMTWAALIKCVYEVDPLKCPRCGGEMRIVSFIEQKLVIEKVHRHCGLWREQAPRPPPEENPPPVAAEPALDYGFTSTVLSAGFEKTCA